MKKSDLRTLIQEEILTIDWDAIIETVVRNVLSDMVNGQTNQKTQQHTKPIQRVQQEQHKPKKIQQPQHRPQPQRKLSSNPLLNEVLNNTNVDSDFDSYMPTLAEGYEGGYTATEYVSDDATNMFVKDYSQILKKSIEISQNKIG